MRATLARVGRGAAGPCQLSLIIAIVVGNAVIAGAGVRIEINRIKDEPKAMPTVGIKSLLESALSTEAPSPVTPATDKATTIIVTTAPLSLDEVTTIPPSPIEYNRTMPAPNAIDRTVQNAWNPLLSEYTRRQIRRNLIPANYYCPCDLSMNFCDINCCCDVDCASSEIIQTLKCSEREWTIHDYEETSALGLCSETSGFSLFCIVDNSRKRKEYRRRDYKIHDVNVLGVVQYNWPKRFAHSQAEAIDLYHEHYVYGDPLLVWDEISRELQHFEIPWSYGTANCRIRSPLRYLVEDEIACVQTPDEHDQFIADMQSNLRSARMMRDRRPAITPTLPLHDYCGSTPNDTDHCFSAAIYHCFEAISSRTCALDANSTIAAADFGDDYITNELSIQIHHNFTSIENFTVFFVYHAIADGDGIGAHVVQTIRLEYLELTETFATRDVHQVSGNIGYAAHKPVIVTKYIRRNYTMPPNGNNINTNNMDAYDWHLAYFYAEANFSNDEHYLKVPTVLPNGDCLLDRRSFGTIDFGENARIKCNAPLTPTAANSTDEPLASDAFAPNTTQMCRTFQRSIFDYLLHRFELTQPNATAYNRFNVLVSELGNPRNDSLHWFEYRTVGAPDLNDIVAIDAADGTEFACTNMVLNVRYEFFYGTMLFGRVPNQALIKVAQIQFGNRLTLKFKLDDDGLRVPLFIDVMFYDFSRVVGNNARAISAIESALPMLITVLLFIAHNLSVANCNLLML